MTQTINQNVSKADGSEAQYPHRQSEVIGYYEAGNFGGDGLRNAVGHLVGQHAPLGNTVLQGVTTIMGNGNLGYREIAMNTAATLTALGDCPNQLKLYVQAALNQGADPDEVLDLYQISQSFAGSPRAVNAIRATYDIVNAARATSYPEAYTEQLVRIGDHDTMVRDTNGPGVPIVLIHALSLDSRMFKHILAALSAATNNARVISYDLRGHGHARGAPLTKSITHLSSDLLLLLDTLNIAKADIYGASYGGTVSQLFALEHPTRTRSVSAIATSAQMPSALATRATRAEEHGVTSLLPECLIRWFRPETIATNPWCVRYARACIEGARVEEWAAAWRAISHFDVLDRLKELRVPMLALSGADDASATPAVMQAIADACQNAGNEDAEFVSVQGGTHMLVMESPEETVEKLAAFRVKVDGLGWL